MNWITIKNNSKISLSSIPTIEIDVLREDIKELKLRPIGFFGQHAFEGVKLFILLADDSKGEIQVSSAFFNKEEKEYECFTNINPAFHIFEREFYEQFNIKPKNHPWLKPLRHNQDDYPFFNMEGDEIHQVAVGPIHAGVIEPGHFRFMCNGEKVYHLEIMLGYQNRDVEELMIQKHSNQLAESICGDSTIGHNMAYSQLIETLSNTTISSKAEIIRRIALEMERTAIHIGDLGAIAGDIAYLMGASVFGATRTLVINTMLDFCGSRFGKGFITKGGVNFDIDKTKIENAKNILNKVKKDVERMTKTMLKTSSVISRLEKTGTVSQEKAKEVGLVGMVAKASGVILDTRFDFKDKWIEKIGVEQKSYSSTGDVNARFKLRYKELRQSISIIKKLFKELENYSAEPIKTQLKNLDKNQFAISITEGWRGEIIHIALTDDNGKICKYKIKDPSFNNWYGLALAVRNNGISDFPLCNKSFNLSYCGNDL